MQRRLGCVGGGIVCVGTLLEKELTKTPMEMEGSGVETHIIPEGLQGFAVGEQKPDGGDVAIVGTVLDE